jgi:tRNA threonylcarbamoyladenosine biosynthesis protein TsaE
MLKNGSVKLSKKVNKSLEETACYAREFAKSLKKGDVVAFFGDLGSGKTTFIRYLASELAKIAPESVNSPTFQYLNIYHGPSLSIYHFDLYRLKSASDFLALGFEEMLEGEGIACIEWAERIADILPERTISVAITHVAESERMIEVTKR